MGCGRDFLLPPELGCPTNEWSPESPAVFLHALEHLDRCVQYLYQTLQVSRGECHAYCAWYTYERERTQRLCEVLASPY
jgi:lysine/ornithine N-monooxygenase